MTAVSAAASSPSVEARTTSQRPDAVLTLARAGGPEASPRATARARLATATTDGGSGPGGRPSPSAASHRSPGASANATALSGASSTSPAASSPPSWTRRRRAPHEDRPAHALGEVGRHARDERLLGRGERVPVVRAQQRQAAPRDVVVDEGGAELVAEAVRPPDLAVAPAAVEVAAGRRAQGGRRPGRIVRCDDPGRSSTAPRATGRAGAPALPGRAAGDPRRAHRALRRPAGRGLRVPGDRRARRRHRRCVARRGRLRPAGDVPDPVRDPAQLPRARSPGSASGSARSGASCATRG